MDLRPWEGSSQAKEDSLSTHSHPAPSRAGDVEIPINKESASKAA